MQLNHITMMCYGLGSEGKLPSAQGLCRTAEEIWVVPVPPDTPACPKTQELRISPSSLEIPVGN